MKKLLTVLFLCFTMHSFAQEAPKKNRTEIKFNLFSSIRDAVEFEFERTLNTHSSIGISFFSSFDENNIIGYEKSISIFYRYYLGKKYASGFFIEGFGMYNSADRFVASSFTPPSTLTRGYNGLNDFALGLGAGYKWVSKKGLVLQANLGIGRNLFNADIGEQNETVGKIGVSIGYRF
jgi:hypothetical protein